MNEIKELENIIADALDTIGGGRFTISTSDGKCHSLVEFWTDTAGQDIPVEIDFDGTKEDFCEKFTEYAENYSVDDEVEIYVGMRGKDGVPNTVKDLLDDCKEAKETLMQLSRYFQTEIRDITFSRETEDPENIFLMYDLESGELDYVLRSKTTTKEQIEKAISDVKDIFEGEWQQNDIFNALPLDVEIIVNYGDCHSNKRRIMY